jgi:hypothetical protein
MVDVAADVGAQATHLERGGTDRRERDVAAHRLDAVLAAGAQGALEIHVAADRRRTQRLEARRAHPKIARDGLGTQRQRRPSAQHGVAGHRVEAHGARGIDEDEIP